MNTRTLLTAVAALAFAHGAAADSYSDSVRACEASIAEHLDLVDVGASYNLEDIRSRARYRDLGFIVSAHDEAHPVQHVDVACRVRKNGEVLAVEFDPASVPSTVASQ